MLYSTLAPSVEGSVRKAAGRVDAVDFARGAALIGMALYHLAWDLADFGFIAPAFPFSPPMRLFSHLVAGAFLALAGVSLALAHPAKIDWRAFWRRIAIPFQLFGFPDNYSAINSGIRTAITSYRNFVLDRKSTRLNSSHHSISYAVFCLK